MVNRNFLQKGPVVLLLNLRYKGFLNIFLIAPLTSLKITSPQQYHFTHLSMVSCL